MPSGDDRKLSHLRWACRRGMRELDLWFLAFLDNEYPTLSADKQKTFEELLNHQDQELFDWFMESAYPTDPALLDMVRQVRDSYR